MSPVQSWRLGSRGVLAAALPCPVPRHWALGPDRLSGEGCSSLFMKFTLLTPNRTCWHFIFSNSQPFGIP